MKILCVHAHYDDFEFVAAGTFETWRRKLGSDLTARVIVCTDGKAGHHSRSREETGRLRLHEQEESARVGGYEFEQLCLPDGTPPREGCLQMNADLLAALWEAIRRFEPDYLFCPPLPADPLAGIHVDHVAVAEAIRRVAYMVNVPHAFTPEYPEVRARCVACKVPVILNVYDEYMAAEDGGFDLAIDVEEAFDRIVEMSWKHQSQIAEWLPWVGRHGIDPPRTIEEWSRTLRGKFERRSRRLGIQNSRAVEVFKVTAWGEMPSYEQILRDFPNVVAEASHLAELKDRLERWRPSDG